VIRLRMAVSPFDWEKAAAFCQCKSKCPAEHKVGLYCLPVEPLHPILKVLKECWTDEVVNAFQYAQDLGNHMAANNGEIPEWSKNNDSNNDSNNSSMKEEFLTNELNSINAMMQSFTQNDYSEQEFIQLQQAQKEVLKQLNQLKD